MSSEAPIRLCIVETPQGTAWVGESDAGVRFLRFPEKNESVSAKWIPVSIGQSDAARQLLEYFDGQRREFQLVYDTCGTEFQERIWKLLREIPYGETWTYGEVASKAGLRAGASRAVGGAIGANPIAIAIPCHRVLAQSGALTGYRWGTEIKQALLHLEGAPALRPNAQLGLFSDKT